MMLWLPKHVCGTHLDEECSPSNVWHWLRCHKGVVVDLWGEGEGEGEGCVCMPVQQ